MQQTRFMVLTGNLADYPLPDLIGILRQQRKTGRLLIEYGAEPAMLYFEDGELVDARFKTLSGLQAVCVALAQPDAAFNFNPLIHPVQRSIDTSLQKVILELCGYWSERAILISSPAASPLLVAGSEPSREREIQLALPEARNLALPSAKPDPSATRLQRLKSVALAVGMLLLGGVAGLMFGARFGRPSRAAEPAQISSVLAANEPSPAVAPRAEISYASPAAVAANQTPTPARREEQPAEHRSNREPSDGQTTRSVAARNDRRPAAPPSVARQPTVSSRSAAPAADTDRRRPRDNAEAARSVAVVVKLDNGRVSQAFVPDRRPGMEAYEALAIRIARQRRYPATATGQEKVTINIRPSN